MSNIIENLAHDIQGSRAGTVAVVAVSASASVVDLSGLPGGIGPTTAMSAQQTNPAIPTAPSSALSGPTTSVQPLINPPGFVGHWVKLVADGADVGFITGPTSASVSGANAPTLATTGGATVAGTCDRIFAGTTWQFLVKGDDRYLGVVGSAGGSLRIVQTSR